MLDIFGRGEEGDKNLGEHLLPNIFKLHFACVVAYDFQENVVNLTFDTHQ